MNGNRTALWALLGVVIGFGLPIMACGGIALVLMWGVGSGSAAMGATQPAAQHVSGPNTGPAIAIIEIEGVITAGGDASIPGLLEVVGATPGRLIPLIKQAAADADVRAVLLKVNSPGGAVVATDEIYHALQTALDKPIVVLMGDIAASGGVYIAMAGDHIMANPNTLTGSIGVRLNDIIEYGDLLARFGIDVTTIKAGAYKDIGSGTRPLTEEEQAILQAVVDDGYANFIGIVAAGRGLSEAEVSEFADGRIFSGERAVELGLIDAVGYEEDAITVAAELGDIEGEPRVIRYGEGGTFLEQLLESSARRFVTLVRNELTGPRLEYR